MYTADHSDDDDDVEFELDRDVLDKPFKNYALKSLAIWDMESVYYVDNDSDHNAFMVWEPRIDGIQSLATKWQHYYHVGDVPPEPRGGAGSTQVKVGRAHKGQNGEWIMDSGAGVHMINEAECKAMGTELFKISPFPVGVVGGVGAMSLSL